MENNTIRLSNDKSAIVLSLHEGRVSISSSNVNPFTLARIIIISREFEASGDLSISALREMLEKKGFKSKSPSNTLEGKSKGRFASAIQYASDTRSPSSLAMQTKEWAIPSAPFRSETLKTAYMRIDTREPKEIMELLEQIKIKSCERMPLEIGDVHIGDMVSDDLLIIERKTVSDLYNSTVSTHLHDQAERLSEYRAKRKGLRTMIVWIVEGEQNGNRTLYNAFAQTKQTDGVVNFLSAIHNHHILSAYNQHHFAYLVAKLAQGFLEGRLFYTLGDAKRVHSDAYDESNATNHTMAKMLQAIPGVNATVAKSIIDNGYSLSELSRLTISELKKLNGVGDKNAQRIYNSLNMKSSP